MKLVHIEDRGQDFTTFKINSRGVIVETMPFQGSIWNGCTLSQVAVGARPAIRRGRSTSRLNYAVTKIEAL